MELECVLESEKGSECNGVRKMVFFLGFNTHSKKLNLIQNSRLSTYHDGF